MRRAPTDRGAYSSFYFIGHRMCVSDQRLEGKDGGADRAFGQADAVERVLDRGAAGMQVSASGSRSQMRGRFRFMHYSEQSVSDPAGGC